MLPISALVRGDTLEGAIVATLSYADIFAFAMQSKEVHRFLLGHRATRPEVENCLERNASLRELIDQRDGLWFLRGKDHLAPRRKRFSKHSEFLWPRARRIAKRLERTGLCLSGMVTGSLAADNADEHADIDFLLIYPGGRTWTSYGLVRVLSNLPVGEMQSMCPNYCLSADKLEVQPQNLFTAWEIAKAVPLFGFEVYEAFVVANSWVGRYLPNALPLLEGPGGRVTKDPPWLRRVIDSPAFSWFEKYEKKRKFQTDQRDVGVDMEDREKNGSMDRHSPTRSFHTLSELRYRMSKHGLEAHPLFAEVHAQTNMLEDEMTRWGSDQLPTALPVTR